jgi:uncharacterized protein YjbK
LVGLRDLHAFAHFSNQRWSLYDGEHELCLDHSIFNGHEHEYELEIESQAINAAAEKWLPLLQQWGYKQQTQSRSKLERCVVHAASEQAQVVK